MIPAVLSVKKAVFALTITKSPFLTNYYEENTSP
jgi:hypothetical protein